MLPTDEEMERDDFVVLIAQLTDYITNERVRAYNEGFDAARRKFDKAHTDAAD